MVKRRGSRGWSRKRRVSRRATGMEESGIIRKPKKKKVWYGHGGNGTLLAG